MLGTQAVKQYFATGTSHYVTPTVSAEWNYNLFYPPIATFSGDGTKYLFGGTWSTVPTADTGRTSASCLKFHSSSSHGSSTTTGTVPFGTNTYKIVFYAKIKETNSVLTPAPSVTLTALTYIDSHRSHSDAQKIDSTTWTKFELFVSSRPVDTMYSTFSFTFDYTSEDGTGNYDVLIDQLQMYQTTAFDYQYGNLWQTEAPFTFFRPGESYVPSGNALTPLPANFRKINTKISSAKTWTPQMPVSPVMYNPRLINSAASNPLFKNGNLSDYKKYKYFVSDIVTKSLGAVYEKEMDVNKIVLKFNVAYGKPTVTLNMYSQTGPMSPITITPSLISDAGVCIVYRMPDGTFQANNPSLSSNPWTVMPTFNLNGTITNSTKLNKFVITQTNFTLDPNYSSCTATAISDMMRLQVVEISPRLELDLTYFTMQVDTSAELDNKSNPLPISAISSNSATVNLSNVPYTVSNQVLSLFSNNSSSSPLKGLFTKNVKFYINFVVRDSVTGATAKDQVIPAGVYYTEVWDGQDIQKTQVTLLDVSKQLQLRSPSDYVSQNENIFKIITNILDFAGFTDYDYDSLKKVTEEVVKMNDGTTHVNTQPIHASFYYADGAQQKVFDVLRELFQVYQIGAYVDAYGVMRFLNLQNILSNKTPNMILHDSSTNQPLVDPTTSVLTNISSNIVQDTYRETTKVKIGQASIKYRIPQLSTTLDPAGVGTPGVTAPLTTSIIDKSDALWALDKDDATTFNYLAQSITSPSQNYFQIDKADLLKTFNSFNIDHDGYAIIEGEVVSFRDKEYYFNAAPGDVQPIAPINDYSVVVSNSIDLKAKIAEFSNIVGHGGHINYTPTGKIVNVERGLFNTPVRTHLVTKTASDFLQRFDKISGPDPLVMNDNVYLTASPGAGKTIYSPKNEISYGYNTFSTKMNIGPNSDANFADGLGGGLVLNINGSSPIYVEIRQDMVIEKVNKKNKQIPGYRLYIYKGDESNSLLDGHPFYSITANMLNESSAYPDDSPFAEFGKVVNLKFVKRSDSSFSVYINKYQLNIAVKSGITLDVSGDYGIFTHARSNVASSIGFRELYACQTQLVEPKHYYHYELQSFANTIVNGSKSFEINYMYQVRPQIVGVQLYDVQYSLAPAMEAYPLKVAYNWYYFSDPVNNQTKLSYISVDEDALNYSNVHSSGFRGRVAIINSSPASVWLKKAPDAKNSVDVMFSINTDSVITLSDEQVITKEFDQSNLADSIEITSNWVQSKKAALGILNNVRKALDGFSRDTEISIYGNPLYEIGDVVKINYSLKNIVDQIYFVQGIKQSFDQGLKTDLILNQIG